MGALLLNLFMLKVISPLGAAGGAGEARPISWADACPVNKDFLTRNLIAVFLEAGPNVMGPPVPSRS